MTQLEELLTELGMLYVTIYHPEWLEADEDAVYEAARNIPTLLLRIAQLRGETRIPLESISLSPAAVVEMIRVYEQELNKADVDKAAAVKAAERILRGD